MPSEPSDGIFDALAVYRRARAGQICSVGIECAVGRAVGWASAHQSHQSHRFRQSHQLRPSSFSRRRESRPVGIGTYRIKRFLQPCVLDSHFHGNDGMQVSVRTNACAGMTASVRRHLIGLWEWVDLVKLVG
ncbi:hypothetical protein [Neisseria lactamica]|uniref:hypothetical protein n=1 Tax=Neisseria lactamica TaxID=486 RepID=UPI0018646615|nr:hypothetical protein [Neisseria lactamica]